MSGHNGGKVALLTGDGSGIGRAAALAFVGSDAAVVIADAGGKQTVALVNERGGEGLFVHTDVAQAREVEQPWHARSTCSVACTMAASRDPTDARGRWRFDREYLIGGRNPRFSRGSCLQRLQGGRDPADSHGRARVRAGGYPRQRGMPRRDRHPDADSRHDCPPLAGAATAHRQRLPAAAARA